MTQDFDAAVTAELVRLTLGGGPSRPELQNFERCELSDLLPEHCAHCVSGARTLGPANIYGEEDDE